MKASTPLMAALAGLAAGQGRDAGMKPVKACASLTAPVIPGASVVSIQAAEMNNMPMRMMNGTMRLSFCDVNVTLTHGTAGDRVRIEVWMPLTNWNMRFQGTGGGGYIAGTFGQAMAPQVAQGYAAASTDAGLSGGKTLDGSNTPLNQQLLVNFASLSIHEMAVVGKALVNQYYGMAANFSYFNGCSTGGRQGMMEAQKYPQDFDGILAIAPAINWAKFVPAGIWPFTVMNQANNFPPACLFNAFTQATVAACDMMDGAKDGILANPGACRFNASSMVGKGIACNGTSIMVTAQHAQIYQQILDGPMSPTGEKLWYGLLPGASVTTLATRQPFSLSATWVQDFVFGQNSSAESIESINAASFSTVLEDSQTRFDIVIGTDDPDLAQFKAAGGKLLTWHGLADQLIFPNGTFDYRQRVQDLMGGAAAVDDFYRVFSAPGVMHCGGGAGAMPTDALGALVNWVEKKQAPDTLPAMKMSANRTQGMVTRNLCRYPFVMQYRTGNVNSAESWTCVPGPNQKVISETTASELVTILSSENSSAGIIKSSLVAALMPLAVLGLVFL